MRTGLYVIMVFAAAWGALALWTIGAPAWTWPAPAAASVLILAWAAPRTPSSADRPPDERRRVGRLVTLWSGLEAVAMLVAVNALVATGRARFAVPAAVRIVALHFLPLARGLPFPLYYATGTVMGLAAASACLLPGAGPQAASAGAAAVILWATAFGFPRAPHRA